MRLRDEYNYIRIENEVDVVPEARSVRETGHTPMEQAPVSELVGYQENGSLDGKLRHVKSAGTSVKSAKMLSLMTVTVAGGAIVGVVALPSSAPTQAELQAEILGLRATSTAIYYELAVGYDDGTYYEGDEITIVLSNDFSGERKEIGYSGAEGVFEGLVPGTDYTMYVMNGDSLLVQKSITTIVLRQEVRFVEWECHCAQDGYFYFEMDYLDEAGTWTGFKAVLQDEYGNVAECEFVNAETQRLDVENCYLRGEVATLTIRASVEEGDELVWTEIYVEQVQI